MKKLVSLFLSVLMLLGMAAAAALPRVGAAGGMYPLPCLWALRRGMSCRPAGRLFSAGLPDAPEDAGARLPTGGEAGVVEYVAEHVSR